MFDVGGLPHTSFPGLGPQTPITESPPSDLPSQLRPLFMNSDPDECNTNLSVCLKLVVDTLYTQSPDGLPQSNYHQILVCALRLLSSNLFVKNYELCVGKLLSLLAAFTDSATSENPDDAYHEMCCLKEFMLILLLLLLKVKNSPDPPKDDAQPLEALAKDALYASLANLDFVGILSRFIASHIRKADSADRSLFIILKFCGDLVFEYLYHVELLRDHEFASLTTRSDLIPTLINHLLANDNFNNYDINGDDFTDEDKLIAYEEFKLLLLINEQYLMKSYSCRDIQNQVFDGLVNGGGSTISGFINLLVYHINREESYILKILILKFLYLVFTTSYTAKLPYVNDLKILVDIFIRELNDINYSNAPGDENRILVITYLRVMYPLLRFSQLSELPSGYKTDDIVELLRSIILNAEPDPKKDPSEQNTDDDVILKLTNRCMSVPWLTKKKLRSVYTNGNGNGNGSASSSSSSLNSKLSLQPELYLVPNTSSDSLAASFTRVASVRASTRNDYHKHTTSHNLLVFATANAEISGVPNIDLPAANNNNVFLLNTMNKLSLNGKKEATPNLLDLPREYLKNKPLPSLDHIANLTNCDSILQRKAMKKKAPPPPPSPSLQHSSIHPNPRSAHGTPPPPPPPRRRR